MNINLKSGKIIKTGKWLGIFFAAATILSSFGSGSMPQINSITDSVLATFGIQRIITGAIMAVLLAFVIIGGIKRIGRFCERLVPFMSFIYILGGIIILIFFFTDHYPIQTLAYSPDIIISVNMNSINKIFRIITRQ